MILQFIFVPFSVCKDSNAFVCLFVRSFVRSFVRLFVRSFARSFVRLFVSSFIRVYHKLKQPVHEHIFSTFQFNMYLFVTEYKKKLRYIMKRLLTW